MRASPWPLVWISLMVLGACAPERLSASRGGVEVPATVELPPTYVGQVTWVEVPLRNTGRASRQVVVETAAPFGLEDARVELGPVVSRAVRVSFAPSVAGEVRGRLRVTREDGTEEVELVGLALEPLPCSPEDPCRPTRFDAAQGRCVEEPLPNGAACANACLEGARCQDGRCVGTARSCEDGDACTLDACDPERGCMPMPRQCEPPTPCQAASCDASRGCVFTDVPDGTACGPADCSSTKVCLAGRCEVRATPEGAPCGRANPCHGMGVCRERTCVLPEPSRTLPVAWRYQVPPDTDAHGFNGVSDEAGNLYWLERRRNETLSWLVSVTRDGALRFRTAVPPPCSPPTWVMVGGGSVFVLSHTSRLEVFRAADGAHAWGKNLLDGAPSAFLYLAAAAYDSRGRLYVLTVNAGGGGEVVALAADSGRLLWRYRMEFAAHNLVLDEAGNLFFATRTWGGPTGPHTSALAVSLTPEGQVRYTLPLEEGVNPYTEAPTLFSGGLLREHELIQLAGPTRSSLDFRLMARGAPVLARTRGVGVECQGELDPWKRSCTSPSLLGFSWPDGHSRFKRELPGELTVYDLNLTSSESVLFITDGSTGSFLREFSLDGDERMRCPLPLPPGALPPASYSRWWSALTGLPGGRWVTFVDGGNIVAFDVPGVEPADEGWTTHRGNPGRTGMPLSP